MELSKFLMAYRSTLHVNTGAFSYFLMFGQEMRTKLPALDFSQAGHKSLEEIRDRDWINKMKEKEYVDKRRRATAFDFEIGDEVLVRKMIP